MSVKLFQKITEDQSPVTAMLILMFLVTAGGALLLYIFLWSGTLLFSTDIRLWFVPSWEMGGPDYRMLKYLQLSQQVSFFLVPSLMLIFLYRRTSAGFVLAGRKIRIAEIIAVILLALLAISITRWTGIVNSKLALPDLFSGIEGWLRQKEERAILITARLMEMPDFLSFFSNLFVLAFIPALSEEMIFRGVLQQLFNRIFRSEHVAVWCTAVIFSTVHLQFYGFIPRLILGLLFGYLFLWSGNISVPVIAHFVNNGMVIGISFFSGLGNQVLNAEELKGEKILAPPVIQIVLFLFLLFLLRRNYLRRITAEGMEGEGVGK